MTIADLDPSQPDASPVSHDVLITRPKPRGRTGPTSPAGKTIVARNATRHGIFAESLIDGFETQADWETHHAGILESLAPETPIELDLAERVALLLWRLRRVTRYEAQVTNAHLAQAEHDAAGQLAEDVREERSDHYRFQYLADDPDALRAAHADLARAVPAFDSLPTFRDDAVIAEGTVMPMIRAVARAAHEDEDGDAFDARCRLALGTSKEWNRSRLARALDSFAKPGVALHDLIQRAHREAKRELAYAVGLIEDLDETTRAFRGRRILPPAKALDRVMKYEAHLNGLLLATLHELEAYQRRRHGDPTLLARPSVSADPTPALPCTTPKE